MAIRRKTPGDGRRYMPVAFTLHPDVVDELNATAARYKLTKSDFVEEAIVREIRNLRKIEEKGK